MKAEALVLIVEDEPLESQLLLEALQAQGFRHPVAVVPDGAAAMDYLHGKGDYRERPAAPPALILLDLHMPRMDGIEVLTRLRQDKWLKYVPVIVFTGDVDDAKRIEALDLGARFVIIKPKSLDEYDRLASHIANLLSFIR